MTESTARLRDRAGEAGAARRVADLALSSVAGEVAAIVVVTPLLLVVAAWNGFPLLFYDTGAYMFQGFALVWAPERSPVYSLFLRYAGGQADLWQVAWLQCFITAVAMVEFARVLRPHLKFRMLVLIAVVLSALTSLAWVSGQIQPDFLTPVLVLTLYPLAFHLKTLGIVRALVVAAICSFAIAGHPSHFGLAAGLVVLLIALRVACVVRKTLPRPSVVVPLICLALGLGLVMQANYKLTHERFFSRTGPVFFAARLLANGSAVKTLDEVCPTVTFKLCPYRHQIPTNADTFLWTGNTPFDKVGRFRGSADEYALLARETLKRHPFQAAGDLIVQAVAQLVLVRSGDGFQPVQIAVHSSFVNHTPNQVAGYLAARQQHDGLHILAVNFLHLPLALLSLVWLVVSLRRNLRARRPEAVLGAFLFFALLGNATICGMISGAHDRYQSRIVWIVPFAFLLTDPRALRRLEPAGGGRPEPGADDVARSNVANCDKYRDTPWLGSLGTCIRTAP